MQSVKKRLASVWIASPKENPETIAGYYSLAPWQIAFDSYPEKLRKKLPEYPIHVTLLARLAVANSFQGHGLGGILLINALRRAWHAAQAVPVQAILVHAKDERAAQFYQRYGLQSLPNEPLHLFMPMASVRQLLEARVEP